MSVHFFWVFAKREQVHSGDFRKKNVFRPHQKSDFGIKFPNLSRFNLFMLSLLSHHGWSGEGLKLELETSYTEMLFFVSSDVSRFE